jgi:hypothetical protein
MEYPLACQYGISSSMSILATAHGMFEQRREETGAVHCRNPSTAPHLVVNSRRRIQAGGKHLAKSQDGGAQPYVQNRKIWALALSPAPYSLS